MSPRPSSPVDVLPERMLSLGIADPPAAAKDAVQTQNAMTKPSSLRSRSSSYSSTSSTAASTAASSSSYSDGHSVAVITPRLLHRSLKAKKKQFHVTMEKALGGGKGGGDRSRKKSAAAAAAAASIRKASTEVPPNSRKRSPPKVKFLDEEPAAAAASSPPPPEDGGRRRTDDVPSPIHARVDGPLVVIGLGSIGRGMLPLIERHIGFDRDEFAVVEPSDDFAHLLEEHGARHVRVALTAENLESTLRGLFPRGGGMIVNLSVDVDSVAVMVLAQDLGALYVDTVIEPWPGVYFDSSLGNAERTNYALRERMRETGRKFAGGSTAVSSCGANPGMVSWLMKEALLRLSEDTGVFVGEGPPETREGWARLAMVLGVKGVHVAERDTQVSSTPKTPGVFVNTWSVDGFLSEGYQPAELGWGTHERRMPTGGRRHDHGNGHGIWIDRPGGDTRVRSWVPGTGPQLGLLVTHNEALSIADYYTVWDGDDAVYRPTCHYAYHPCNDAVLSLYETNGAGRLPEKKHILTADEIVSGNDDLGVLLYGHAKGAMWYGSRLSIDEARRLAPYQNATGMQVTSAVLAGMVWALENPNAGFVEADEMDHVRCLQIQRPYLGSVECHYTDWTPVRDRINTFGEDRDDEDPWQFTNFLV